MDTDGSGTIDENYDYTYNPANQLVEEDGPTDDWYYEYDGNSNLTYRKDDLDEPTHTDAYTYNFLNQLTTYNPDGASNTTTYTYNLAGERVRKDSAELVTDSKFVYAYGQILTEYDADDSDVLLRTNIWGSRATTFINNGSPDTFYYTFRDGFNSVYNIIDASGDVLNTYDYTAFGEPYAWSESVTNAFTFYSNQYNAESTAYFNGISYRNPTTNNYFQCGHGKHRWRFRGRMRRRHRCTPAFIQVAGNGVSSFADDTLLLGPNTNYHRIGYAFDAYLVANLEGCATIKDCFIDQYIFLFWTYKTKSGNTEYWHHIPCESGIG